MLSVLFHYFLGLFTIVGLIYGIIYTKNVKGAKFIYIFLLLFLAFSVYTWIRTPSLYKRIKRYNKFQTLEPSQVDSVSIKTIRMKQAKREIKKNHVLKYFKTLENCYFEDPPSSNIFLIEIYSREDVFKFKVYKTVYDNYLTNFILDNSRIGSYITDKPPLFIMQLNSSR